MSTHSLACVSLKAGTHTCMHMHTVHCPNHKKIWTSSSCRPLFLSDRARRDSRATNNAHLTRIHTFQNTLTILSSHSFVESAPGAMFWKAAMLNPDRSRKQPQES